MIVMSGLARSIGVAVGPGVRVTVGTIVGAARQVPPSINTQVGASNDPRSGGWAGPGKRPPIGPRSGAQTFSPAGCEMADSWESSLRATTLRAGRRAVE